MNRSTRIFRWVWRIDAIVILIAAGAIAIGALALAVPELMRERERAREHRAPSVPAKSLHDATLELQPLEEVAGTATLRGRFAAPSRGGSYSSSGGYTANMLYVDARTAAAHWLLPGDADRIETFEDLQPHVENEKRSPVATIALVKRGNADEGRLLLFALDGTNVRTIANAVRSVSVVRVDAPNSAILATQTANGYHIVTIDPAGLAVRSDRAVIVPPLH